MKKPVSKKGYYNHTWAKGAWTWGGKILGRQFIGTWGGKILVCHIDMGGDQGGKIWRKPREKSNFLPKTVEFAKKLKKLRFFAKKRAFLAKICKKC